MYKRQHHTGDPLAWLDQLVQGTRQVLEFARAAGVRRLLYTSSGAVYGRQPADVPALRDALLRVSALVSVCPEIQELDINPLRVLTRGAHALDIRVRVGAARTAAATRRITY